MSAIPTTTSISIAQSEETNATLGSMDIVDLPEGSMELAPGSGEKGLMLRGKGRNYNINFKNTAQKTKHEQLHNALISGHPANATINLSRGWIEVDGQIIEYLSDDPAKAKLLHEMRMLYHEALGQRYSDILWHDYAPHDRASTKDPLPFQQRQTVDVLKNIKAFPRDSVLKGQLQEFYFAQKLHRGIVDILDNHSGTLGASTQAESRKAQLAKLKERYEKLDEWVIHYHAAHPLPDLSGLGVEQAKRAIASYRNEAMNFLMEKVKETDSWIPSAISRKNSDNPDVQKAVSELALEMALMACKSRADYDQLCLAFETNPRRTSPEMFVMQLSRAAVTGANTNNYIDEHFPIAFNGLSNPEDRDEVQHQLKNLVSTIHTELSDPQLINAEPAAYHARIEQVEIVKRQRAIAQAHKDLAVELGRVRSDLTYINEIEYLGGDLDDCADSLNTVSPTDPAAYKPIANSIQAHIKTQKELLKRLQNEADQNRLRPFINGFQRLIQEQMALEATISDKVPY